MFKDYKGFDLTKLFKGLIVYVHDSFEPDNPEDINYTDFYLINDVDITFLTVVDSNGDKLILPIDKFTQPHDETGDYSPYSRLSLEIPEIKIQ